MRENGAGWYPVAVIAVVVTVLATGTVSNLYRNPQPELVSEGFAHSESGTSHRLAEGAPGAGRSRLELVRQAVADLDALTSPSGATLAGANGPWRFVWPRDASFVAAARCSLGQYEEAGRVLGFLDRIHPQAGRWEARYHEDGTPVRDGREAQLDGSGWVLWATWLCHRSQADKTVLRERWDMVRESAEHIVSELGENDLPRLSPDYWELPERELTLGTVAPLIMGLRAAAGIAQELDRPEVTSWRDAAQRLTAATDQHFGPTYPRTPARAVSFVESGLEPVGLGGGADAIVTVLGPPFARERTQVTSAIERARKALTLPNGGITPGERWRADGVAWTPQTTLFALSAAARGDRNQAVKYLSWLDSHRTTRGALPEKVNRDLQPAGEAPLAWTSALVVLTSAAMQDPLPVP